MKYNDRLIEKIYCILVAIYSFSSVLLSTYIDNLFFNYSQFYDFLRYTLIFAFLVIFILNIRCTKKTFAFIILFCMFIGVVLMNNTDKSFLLIILILISFPKNMELQKMSKLLFDTNVFTILLVAFLYKVGFINEYVFIQRGVTRHSLGFVSANALSNLITSTLLLHIYYKNDRWNIIKSLFWCIVLLLIYRLTYSRLALILGMTSLIFITFYKFIKNNKIIKNILFFCSKYIFPFLFMTLTLLTIYLSVKQMNSFFNEINELFSNRLCQMIDFYRKYGIHLLGQPIETVSIHYVAENGGVWLGLDTSYMNYLLRYGFIFMLLISYCYIKSGNFIKKKDLLIDAIYIIFICIMGITENILLIPYYNLSMFIIIKCLYCYKDDSGGKYEKNNCKSNSKS